MLFDGTSSSFKKAGRVIAFVNLALVPDCVKAVLSSAEKTNLSPTFTRDMASDVLHGTWQWYSGFISRWPIVQLKKMYDVLVLQNLTYFLKHLTTCWCL